MKEYHKIQTLFKRDMDSKRKTLIEGEWTTPEFNFLSSNTWVFTEKVDGTNIRIMYSDGYINFGGKTDSAQIPSDLINRLNDIFLTNAGKKAISETFDCDVCLYGEGYGAKIQKCGGNYRQDQDFVLFDVKVGDWWLQRKDVEGIANKLSIDVVPIIGKGTLLDAVEITKKGMMSQWGDFLAEGIVARPETELKARNGDRIITKIKHRDFVS